MVDPATPLDSEPLRYDVIALGTFEASVSSTLTCSDECDECGAEKRDSRGDDWKLNSNISVDPL